MNAMKSQFAVRSRHWQADLQAVFARVGRHFGRQAMRQRALEYITGLLSPVECKTSWQLTEASPLQYEASAGAGTLGCGCRAR
jgi:hypothetical protein